jgi:hypothetical protein
LDLRTGGCLIREQGNLGSVPATAPFGSVEILLEIQSRQLFLLLVFVRIVAGDSPGALLSHRIESLEDLWSKSFSRGSFPNTPTRCSVKCLRGDKLFFESILPRLRTRRILPGLKTGPILLVCFVRFYQLDFTRAENLSVLSDFTSQILPELRTCPN